MNKKRKKTPVYTLKANDDYMERNDFIWFSRRIKPEWKKPLVDLLELLRKGTK